MLEMEMKTLKFLILTSRLESFKWSGENPFEIEIHLLKQYTLENNACFIWRVGRTVSIKPTQPLGMLSLTYSDP